MAAMAGIAVIMPACATSGPDSLATPPVTGEPVAADSVMVHIQEVRAENRGGAGFLSADLLATTDAGALPCDHGYLDVSLAIADNPDGPFTELPADGFQIRCTAQEGADMALVVDNSGSETGFLPWLQQATDVMVDNILGNNGRVSLVRVSTDSAIKVPLTEDESLLTEAVDELFITNGWTALYDGIRMGNESLGQSRILTDSPHDDGNNDSDDAPSGGDETGDFCSDDRKLGIVVFTDGGENNSAHQRYPASEDYPGDGVDTNLEDLFQLEVAGVNTPIYTVGLGQRVDHEGLTSLALTSGGRHHRIDDEADLPDVFQVIADYVSSGVKVCADLPDDLCGNLYVRMEYRWSACDPADDDCDVESSVTGVQVQEVRIDCPIPQEGRRAAILLTLSNPGIELDLAQTLAVNAVTWASPVAEPRVLVVKDDDHHGEFEEDAAYVYELLRDAALDVEFIDEPRHGISDADVAGFDVVWLSNPGHPPDDRATLDTLARFAANGGGYILQGDDFTRMSGDSAVSMAAHTGLVHESNGTRFCERNIDNNRSSRSYRVQLDSAEHPLLVGISGQEFLYGDDIDISTPAGAGEEVLAWADGVDADGEVFCQRRIPVIVALP